MLTFRLTADAVFMAEDIDDAFAKLAAYFKTLADDGLDGESLFFSGHCDVRGVIVKDQNEEP